MLFTYFMQALAAHYPVTRLVLHPRDLVKKTTGSGNYLSLIENGLMAFGC